MLFYIAKLGVETSQIEVELYTNRAIWAKIIGLEFKLEFDSIDMQAYSSSTVLNSFTP